MGEPHTSTIVRVLCGPRHAQAGSLGGEGLSRISTALLLNVFLYHASRTHRTVFLDFTNCSRKQNLVTLGEFDHRGPQRHGAAPADRTTFPSTGHLVPISTSPTHTLYSRIAFYVNGSIDTGLEVLLNATTQTGKEGSSAESKCHR